MAEPEWELLTLRGLDMTVERAAEFVGTFVIRRAGSAEPVVHPLAFNEEARWLRSQS
jgi:hypothetical protein